MPELSENEEEKTTFCTVFEVGLGDFIYNEMKIRGGIKDNGELI